MRVWAVSMASTLTIEVKDGKGVGKIGRGVRGVELSRI
jgi:hypothetical protein